MKIVLVTDAWTGQINGVVRTLEITVQLLRQMGHSVYVVEPSLFKTIKAPKYPEIKLAINPWTMKPILRNLNPDVIHIATEGPLGLFARRYCSGFDIPYTTSYHTKWPEYIRDRWPVPTRTTYAYVKWFHKNSSSVLVTTKSMKSELLDKGFLNTTIWSRGVDTELFHPNKRVDLGLPKPIFGYVGRVSVEKNIEKFLDLDLPGSKVVVGDGPARKRLEKRYSDVVFVGMKSGEELATYYASLDVKVFPSVKDTLGVVMLEANAAGVPVAAYPVTGPIDIIKNGINGFMDYDLRKACLNSLTLDRTIVRNEACNYSWQDCTNTFLNALCKIS